MLARHKQKDTYTDDMAQLSQKKPNSGRIVKSPVSKKDPSPSSKNNELSNFQSFAGNSTREIPKTQSAKDMSNLRQEAQDFFSYLDKFKSETTRLAKETDNMINKNKYVQDQVKDLWRDSSFQ